jgi:hypothetical protein
VRYILAENQRDGSSETSILTRTTRLHHIPGDSILRCYLCENIKSKLDVARRSLLIVEIRSADKDLLTNSTFPFCTTNEHTAVPLKVQNRWFLDRLHKLLTFSNKIFNEFSGKESGIFLGGAHL